MPPRSNLAVRQPEVRKPHFDFAGRRLKLVSSPQPQLVLEEPSPMMEAIRRYLDSLP